MAFRRRPCSFLLALVLVSHLAVGSQADGWGETAVFWGRNKTERTLREACDTGAYNAVLISFLRTFDHGKYDDIKYCQSKGIVVLLCIGGPGYGGSSYSLPSSKSAADVVAAYLWDTYLSFPRPGVHRPFGDATLDGIDFYIDQGPAANYDELARLMTTYNKSWRGRYGVTLTATVRCAYPDPRMGPALATGLFFRIHVRLYGGDLRCTESGSDAMEKWMAKYPTSKLFVGVSAEDKHGGVGDLKDLYYDILQFVNKLPNFGGLMIWNRYYDKMNHFISHS